MNNENVLDGVNIKATCEEILSKIQHNENRLPYTYHHDYLRPKLTKLGTPLLSRGDVAFLTRESSDSERYACALLMVIEYTSAVELLTLPREYANIISALYVYADEYVDRLKANL